MRKNGFTLIELMIVISVLAVLTVSSTTLFYQSLRTTNRSQSLIESDKNAQFALTVIEGFVKNARRVTAVGAGSCPGTSDTLTLLTDDESQVQFSLSAGRIASNSSYLTSPTVTVEDLQFTCNRTPGAPDQIVVTFDIIHTTTANDATTEKTYTRTLNLRNYL